VPRPRRPRRPAVTTRLVAAAVAVVALGAACSTRSGAATGTSEVGRSVPDGVEVVDAPFRAFGSIDRANVVDAEPGSELVLYDGEGTERGRGRADRLGSFIFRFVRPGDGYVVEQRQGDELRRSEPFGVLAEADTPPASLYRDQELREGLNYVRMRDGIELAMTVRLPSGKDLDDGPFPTVIEYSGYAAAAPGDIIADVAARLVDPSLPADPLVPATSTAIGSVLAPQLGYASVSVQIRGSGCSGGDFDLFGLPTIYDGYDAVETVAAQPWVKGGKVGMVGISFSGFSQLFVAGTRPPSLAAVAPMAVLGDMYEGIGFPGGIFNDGFAKGWLTERAEDAKPAPEAGQPWARALVAAGDERCRANQALRLQTIDVLGLLGGEEFRTPVLYAQRTPADWAERIEVPVFLVGAFQDDQLGGHWANLVPRLDGNDRVWVTMFNGNHNDALGPEVVTRWAEFLELYVADEVPEIPGELLALAPVLYQQFGSAAAPAPTQTRFAGTTDVDAARRQFEADPRIRLLMEVGGGPLGPRSLQSTSEITASDWPLPDAVATRWHLAGGGRLVADGEGTGAGEDSYRADPSARPERSAPDGGVAYSADGDYTWEPVADGRGLGYLSEPLQEDLLVAGPGSLDLRVASSDEDADLQVTLSEVRPDGRETYLTSGWLRLSHRALDRERTTELVPVQTHREQDARPLVPGEAVDARVPIHAVAAWLRAGSRLRVTVLAPGGDVPLWEFRTVEDGDDIVTVVRDEDRPSSLVLPVVRDATAPTPLPGCDTLRGQPCRVYVPAANGG
jgi:predicted acyl esterase